MMNKLVFCMLLLTPIFAFCGNLTVNVKIGVEGSKGQIMAQLLDKVAIDENKKDGLVSQVKTIAKGELVQKGTVITFVFKDVKVGDYVLKAFVDMDTCMELDFENQLPSEPWGTSGIRSTNGKITFNDSKFTMPKSDLTLDILVK